MSVVAVAVGVRCCIFFFPRCLSIDTTDGILEGRNMEHGIMRRRRRRRRRLEEDEADMRWSWVQVQTERAGENQVEKNNAMRVCSLVLPFVQSHQMQKVFASPDFLQNRHCRRLRAPSTVSPLAGVRTSYKGNGLPNLR